MAERIDPVRETRQCVCGQIIVLQRDPTAPAAEDDRVVLDILTDTGAHLQQCPRCGTTVTPEARRS